MLTIYYIKESDESSDPFSSTIITELRSNSRVGSIHVDRQKGYTQISYFPPEGYWSSLDDGDDGDSGNWYVLKISTPDSFCIGEDLKLKPVSKDMFVSPPFKETISYCLFKRAWFWVLKHDSEFYIAIDNEDFSLKDLSFVAIQPEEVDDIKKEDNSILELSKMESKYDINDSFGANKEETLRQPYFFCRKCGKKIPVDSHYCMYCGEEILTF